MRTRARTVLLQLCRVAGVVFLYALIGVHQAGAQLPPTPSAAGGTPACDVRPAAAAQAFPCGVIITDGQLSSSDLASRARGAGADVRFEYRTVAAVAATVPHRAALQALRSGVTLIPDRRMAAIAKPTKGGGGTAGQVVPEGVKRIGAAPGQASSTGSGTGVAIVDTGIDLVHADLTVESAYFDAFGGSGQDQNGHGTHVAGIVAAKNNTLDVVGVAPDVALYSVRVLDASGSGSDSTVMAGLDWIADNFSSRPIKVVNMSLGRPGTLNDNPALRALVQDLTSSKGVTIVVAAGNDAQLEIHQQVPAAYPEALAIASTTAVGGTNLCSRVNGAIEADTASYFTSDGAGVAVSAPGEDRENVSRGCFINSSGILSLKRGGGTTRMSGTSMAAPHVAGVAALLISQGSITDPASVRARLACSAQRKGQAPLASPAGSYTFDNTYEGIVSAQQALIGCQ